MSAAHTPRPIDALDMLEADHRAIEQLFDAFERAERNDFERKNALVLMEGVYSLDGDTAPIADFVEVCSRYDAVLLYRLDIESRLGAGVVQSLRRLELDVIELPTLDQISHVDDHPVIETLPALRIAPPPSLKSALAYLSPC